MHGQRPYPWLMRCSWLILLWLWIWPLVMPMLAVAAVYGAAALLNLPAMVPPLVWFGLLAVGAGVQGWLVLRLLRMLRLPSWYQAARFLELENGVGHQPLSGYHDVPVSADDPEQLRLWQAHRRRLLDRTPLHLPWLPASPVAKMDPYGLRVGAWLCLIVAWVLAGPHAKDRLLAAVDVPNPLAPQQVEVWVTPPTYTRLDTKSFGPVGQAQAVPEGSRLLVLVKGSLWPLSVDLGSETQAMEDRGQGAYGLDLSYNNEDRLRLTFFGLPVATWPLAAITDQPPVVQFADPPQTLTKGRLAVKIRVEDDYGLKNIGMEIDGVGQIVSFPRPSGGVSRAVLDLAASPLAGYEVTARPYAVDEGGHRTLGPAITFELPERHFLNPVAHAIIQQRQLLMEDDQSGPQVSDALDEIAVDSEIGDDSAATLMVALVQQILLNPAGDIDEAVDVLWALALRLEDGKTDQALRALLESRHILQNALDAKSDADFVASAYAQYMQAVAKFLSSVTLGTVSPQVLSSPSLQQQMEAAIRSGDAELAKSLLAQMDQWLDNLQSQVMLNQDMLDVLRLQIMARSILQNQEDEQKVLAAQKNVFRLFSRMMVDPKMAYRLNGSEMALSVAGNIVDALRAIIDKDAATAQQHQTAVIDAISQWAANVLSGQAVGRDANTMAQNSLPDSPLFLQDAAGQAQKVFDELTRRATDGNRSSDELDYLRRLLENAIPR